MSASATPSFATDLKDLREAHGLGREDIQRETRVPADVIRRLEDGTLLADNTFNDVYMKALLKAYAKAVEVPSADVVQAYEAALNGRYAGSLRRHLGEEVSEAPPPVAPPEDPGEAPKPPPASGAAPAVSALAGATREPNLPTKPPTGPVSTTPSRVKKPAGVKATRSFDKSWGVILGVALLALFAIAALLWFMFRSPDDGLQPVTTAAEDSVEVAPVDTVATDTDTPEVAQGPRLSLPIQVTVLATGNGLQNFRVTEEPNQRLGHWVEPGNTISFESDSAIVLWGEGAEGLSEEATLRLQGLEWTPADGRILTIDRTTGQRLLDSLSAVGSTPAAEPAAAGQ